MKNSNLDSRGQLMAIRVVLEKRMFRTPMKFIRPGSKFVDNLIYYFKLFRNFKKF